MKQIFELEIHWEATEIVTLAVFFFNRQANPKPRVPSKSEKKQKSGELLIESFGQKTTT